MKERPILFSTPMVQAILEGRKTQTRRIIKPQPDSEPYFAGKLIMWYAENKPKGLSDCPYGQPGDLLWVREKTIRNNNSNTYWPVADGYIKTADYEKTIPSIHMPKAAARIWLKVKDVRVERLQEISERDILNEGVRIPVNPDTGRVVVKLGVENSTLKFLPSKPSGEKYNQNELLHAHWAELWCEVNGRKSWEANPWVWVVEFEMLSKTGKPETTRELEPIMWNSQL